MVESHERPWATKTLTWLLGGWLFLAVVTGYLAGANLLTLKPDALPRAAEFYGDIPEERREMALRYAGAILNRKYFTEFYAVQFVIAAGALALAALSGRTGRLLIVVLGATLALSTVLTFWLTPEIIEVGQRIDDVPREPLTPDREAFQGLHRMAVMLDGSKVVLLVIAGVLMIRGGAPKPACPDPAAISG